MVPRKSYSLSLVIGMQHCFFYGVVLLCLLISNIAFAVDEFSPDFDVSGIDIFGYIDTSYNYLLRKNKFTSGYYNRSNDLNENGFTLQQANLILTKMVEQGWGGYTDLLLGRDANMIAANGVDPNIIGGSNTAFTIPQAYLFYKKNQSRVMIGEMQVLAGLEQYEYPGDTNFSRSILDAFAQPGTHIGIRGMQEVTQKTTVFAGLTNGWNTVRKPYQINFAEYGMIYKALPRLSFTLDVYTGQQYLTDIIYSGPTGWRNLFDFYGILKLTDKLTVATNYDYGFQTKALLPNGDIARAIWQGIGGYLNYDFTEKWRSSFRAEIFNDPDGYRTGVRQSWEEITLSLAYEVIKNLQCRVETRHDFSNVNSFLDKNGMNTSNNQQSYSFDILYQF